MMSWYMINHTTLCARKFVELDYVINDRRILCGALKDRSIADFKVFDTKQNRFNCLFSSTQSWLQQRKHFQSITTAMKSPEIQLTQKTLRRMGL